MTPDDLEAIVLREEDPWKLQQALAPLDEKERAKLSAPAQKLFNQLYRNKANESASDRLKTFIARRKGDFWKHWNAKESRCATLALFALCPISVLKKPEVHIWHEERAVFETLIRDRRPEWLDDWIAYDLEERSSKLDFGILRGWINDGICRKPDVDGYYRMFAWHLMRTGFYQQGEIVPPITVQLLADPGLLDDIEGLFRVEHIGFNTNSWLTKGAADGYETWPDALVKLADQEHLERERLLTLALQGLRLDIKQNQLAGFHGFYKRMAPTAEEQVRHQQDYIALLCHPVGHVVKFAIDMLAGIEKAGALDTGPVVREVQSVFTCAGKGNAVAALKLLKRVVARQKASDPATLATVCEALRHVDAEVQSQALDILEGITGELGEAEFRALRDAESFVSASNRGRLLALLAGSDGKAALESTSASAAPVARENKKPSEAVAYRPISEEINDHQVLFTEDALTPILSVDELIDVAFHTVEVVESPDDVERIIDAISRLVADRPADFDARVAPLLHRLKAGRVGSNSLAIGAAGVGGALLDLLYTWLTGRHYRTDRDYGDRYSDYYAYEDAFQPIIEHLRAISERVSRGKAQTLLAAPTHKGGWIDPITWVERLRGMQQLDGIAGTMDFRLSLLRLAPDNRAAALDLAQSFNARWRGIVLFALGGEERPGKADRQNYASWISAARCRAPLFDWSGEFAHLELDDQWPDSLRPARYEWRATYKTEKNRVQSWQIPDFTVSILCSAEPASNKDPGGVVARLIRSLSGVLTTDWAVLPTAALNRRMEHKRYWSGELSTTWVAQWLAYIWPQNPAAAFIKGTTKLAHRLDDDSSSWSPGFGYFRALFQRNRSWREPGHLVLCLGLIGKDADAKGLAVDALIEGIENRLFDPDRFATVLGSLAEGKWVKYNRLADGLMLAMQVSDLHAVVIGQALQKSLRLLDLQQKNAFRLLEVLVEAQALTTQSLGGEVQEALRKVTGTGKAAKLAKRLLVP